MFAEGGNAFGSAAVLGTNDAQPLELRVGGKRAMMLVPGTFGINIVAGHWNNSVSPTLSGQAVLGGGGDGTTCQTLTAGPRSCANEVFSNWSTIAGGAANRVTGAIDVFDSDYQLTTLPAGAFDAGPNPDGLVPFNVQTIGGFIYVTFSIPGVDADEAPLGSGFVNVYNADGSFVRRIDSDQFASPWGVVLAPDDFGEFSNALLIGNFNDEFGFINAFDADTGEFIGTMLNSDGDPLIIPYLWALLFGNGVLSDADDLYFAAGIGDELHGLFGAIDVGASAVSEPGTAALMLLALAGMVGLRGRRGLEPGRAGFVAG